MAYLYLVVIVGLSAAVAIISGLYFPFSDFPPHLPAILGFAATAICCLLLLCYRLNKKLNANLSALEQHNHYQLMLDSSPVASVLLNSDYTPLAYNKTFADITGLGPVDSCTSGDISKLVRYLSRDCSERIVYSISNKQDWQGELKVKGRDQYLAAELHCMPAGRDGKDLFVFSFENISEHKAIADQLFVREHYSLLTGLPNRELALKTLENSIALNQHDDDGFVLLHLDLDRVRYLNDSLGTAVVDRLIAETAERLQRCLREDQLVAHLGADEFIVVLGAGSCIDEAQILAESLLTRLSDRFVIGKHNLTISGSIGICRYPEDGTDPPTLMRRAEAAMYEAKNKGGNSFVIYQAGISSTAEHRVETESHLHHALEREQFELFFQPVIDLNSHKLIGSEVLLRWHNRDLNNPGPAEFIYIAEECGLINPIGEWILIKACKQVVQWQQAGLPKINVAVNISARQFEDDAIVDSVVRALNQSGLPPQQLELEVTEGLLLHDTPNIRACFNKLKHMGVRISLDDFGVGYASLSYLKSYPFDILKVDRSFVQDIDTDEGSVTLIDAIINMAQTFGMKVIAEGVENLQQRRILREKNCAMVQGYLYSPPLNADQFYEWAKRYCDVQQTQHS